MKKLLVGIVVIVTSIVGLSTPAFAFCEGAAGGVASAHAEGGGVVRGWCNDGSRFYSVG